MTSLVAIILLVVLVALAATVVARAVRIVPQARAGIVERFGRYHRTLNAGLNTVTPFADRLLPLIDLREQVVSFPPQPVITRDNLVVGIDTVIYFQVTDAGGDVRGRQLHHGGGAAHRHDAAQRGGRHGPGDRAHLP
jgi:regulator of protease activity HflC (stomatin/prohibitin superfamily)